MRDFVVLAIVTVGILASVTSAHDLLFKSVRPKLHEDLPETIPIFKKIPAFRRSQTLHLPSVKSATSHDNRCRATEQRCALGNGFTGCCPHENGTCCADMLTCCPNGFDCNIKDGTCTERQHPKYTSVVCPDGQSQCPDGATCCKLQSGQWGCCPLEKATCCSDGIHCCPNGYQCDVSHGTCTKGDLKHIFLKTRVSSVVCPDGQSECPDGSTCCKLQSGQWGCCPLEKATCCSDGIHCCPNGYQCDVSHGTCTKGDLKHTFLKTKPQKAKSVVCPDGQSECPDGATCCKLQSGQWGCCPLEKATCCSDGIHCCPNGYQCDVSHGTCTKQSGSVAVGTKLSSCCRFLSGSLLCCKNGLVCDPSNYECTQPKSQVNQFLTTDAVRFGESVRPSHASLLLAQSRFISCGMGYSCGTKSTCCRTLSGSARCCGLLNGVCCPGGSHCCPYGFTCNGSGKCTLARSP